jgi:hypothetical protein
VVTKNPLPGERDGAFGIKRTKTPNERCHGSFDPMMDSAREKQGPVVDQKCGDTRKVRGF